jgi:hypothetical protein
MAGHGLKALLTAAFLLGFAVIPANAAPNPATQYGYRILRNGDQIGREYLEFRKDGNNEDVTAKIDIVFRLAFVPVYRFTQTVGETWRDGRLLAMRSHTDDNGTRHRLTVKDRNNGLMVDSDGKRRLEPAPILPASLWNMAVLRQPALIDTTDGSTLPITVSDRGPDTIIVDGRRVRAHHYRLTGGLDRDLWYDSRGRLLQVRFTASDGSEIRFVPS